MLVSGYLRKVRQSGSGILTAFRNLLTRALHSAARAPRIRGASRLPYDEFMHRCHNAMKENEAFQKDTPKHHWESPPNSSWMVCTDCVSHAVLSGQYALERTLFILQFPWLAVLESLARRPLTV